MYKLVRPRNQDVSSLSESGRGPRLDIFYRRRRGATLERNLNIFCLTGIMLSELHEPHAVAIDVKQILALP